MCDQNFSLQFYCSDKYGVTTVCTAEMRVERKFEAREENVCGPGAFKRQLEVLSIYIKMDANIVLCVYIYVWMYMHT